MNTPTLADFKLWLGLEASDTADDAALQSSLNAALAAQSAVIRYPVDSFGAAVFTPDLETAVYLRAVRLAARRNSPESVIGISGTDGDFISARLPGADADVTRLEGPYFVAVVG